MGGHRKHKAGGGASAQGARKPSASPPSSLHDRDESSPPSTGSAPVDYLQTLKEAEASVFAITWKEILWILAAGLSLAAFSICMGMAGGMSLSIHYHGTLDALSASPARSLAEDSKYHENGLIPYQRVTLYDQSIADTSYLTTRAPAASSEETTSPPLSLDLGRVVTMSASGRRKALQVVEESSPIKEEGGRLAETLSEHGSALPPLPQPPKLEWREIRQVQPILCADGYTVGYDNWTRLRAAVEEVNLLSAQRYLRWTAYFAKVESMDASGGGAYFEDDSLYYEEEIVLTICPGVTIKAWKGPIFVNAENIRIECEDCVWDVGGSHLAFGPHARNVLVRGITFMHARRSSLLFYNDGAEATFEDCAWKENGPDNRKFGAVADVNSTSILNFYRCQIGNERSGIISYLMRSYLPLW